MSERGFSTRLKAGDAVFLRPIGPQDRAREVEIISSFSEHSRYLRFFSGAPTLPDAVIDQLVAVDGYTHIAWGALDLDVAGAPLMGGCAPCAGGAAMRPIWRWACSIAIMARGSRGF